MSKSYKILEGLHVVKESGIPKHILVELPAIFKSFAKIKNGSWESYYKSVMYNIPDFAYLYTSKDKRLTDKEDLSLGITSELIDRIRQEWTNIPDVSIKTNINIKIFVTHVIFPIIRFISSQGTQTFIDTKLRDKYVDNYITSYNTNFKVRNVPFKKYVELTLKAFEERFIKKHNIAKAQVSKAVDLVKLYLVATPLEKEFKTKVSIPPSEVKKQVSTKVGKVKF